MSSSDEDHTCPICLEPIFQPPHPTTDTDGNSVGDGNVFTIGATVPCGHLFHYDCFASWQASKSYGAVKCPTCNVKTDNFIRLYLDVGSLAGSQCQYIGDDDISLTSIQENEDNDDAKDREDGETEESVKEGFQKHNIVDETDDVVDLTMSPQRPKERAPKRSDSPVQDDDSCPERQSKLLRLSRIAKKFKKQFLQKSAQYKEQVDSGRKLSDRVRKAECERKSLQEELSELERDRELSEMRLNESRLNLLRVQQERDQLHSRYSTMTKEKSIAEARLNECRSHYEKELEIARKKSMLEVQEILEDHPKVVAENRVLKQKLQKLNRSLSRGNQSIETSSRDRPVTKNINKALRQMDQMIRSESIAGARTNKKFALSGSENRNNQFGTRNDHDSEHYMSNKSTNTKSSYQNRALSTVSSGQYSSLASRMMKASQKSKRPTQVAAAGKKRPSITALTLSQNKRLKSFSASRKDHFQRKP